ncbi:hypothetical protein VTJ04DRAFT_8368 [Mycothermus thermophilus]|uniref:uncharacterized protein n=1 Tax=Humicola insolens TaxID=85995 RepID=UPI003742979E
MPIKPVNIAPFIHPRSFPSPTPNPIANSLAGLSLDIVDGLAANLVAGVGLVAREGSRESGQGGGAAAGLGNSNGGGALRNEAGSAGGLGASQSRAADALGAARSSGRDRVRPGRGRGDSVRPGRGDGVGAHAGADDGRSLGLSGTAEVGLRQGNRRSHRLGVSDGHGLSGQARATSLESGRRESDLAEGSAGIC